MIRTNVVPLLALVPALALPQPGSRPSGRPPPAAEARATAPVDPAPADDAALDVAPLGAAPTADAGTALPPHPYTVTPGDTLRVRIAKPMELSNQGGIITLLNEQGLKVDGVSYTKAQAQEPGWTIVFDR